MDKSWKKIDLSNLKHGVMTRLKNEVINSKWKYLIRRLKKIKIIRILFYFFDLEVFPYQRQELLY